MAVLGPLRVLGAARPLRRSRTLELVAYLALHPAGASTDGWATALWPDRVMAPPTLHSTCSAARRSLGRSRGGADHLPRARGGLRLRPTVGTDWQCLRTLAASDDAGDWHRALGLVRGRPFEDLPGADWPVLEGFVAEMEEAVADVALRLADHHLGEGGARQAAAVARRGLRASPYDERLYRVLLRAADAEGHPGGVESVMAELGRLLGGGLALPPTSAPGSRAEMAAQACELVHPRTAALYRSLARPAGGRARRGAEPGAAPGGLVPRH